MSRPEGMKKIPVECLEYYGQVSDWRTGKEYQTLDQFDKGFKNYGFQIRFCEDPPHRKEFAALRKEIKSYIAEKSIRKSMFNTTGFVWMVSDAFLVDFADWIVMPDVPLDVLKMQACERAKVRAAQREKAREERLERERLKAIEERKQYHINGRNHRIHCTNPCKVRVLKFECKRESSSSRLYDGEPVLHEFYIELDNGKTKQEKEARKVLSRLLLGSKGPPYTINSSEISGGGCKWILHEYVIFSYLNWLDLPDAIGTLIYQAVTNFKKREANRKREEEETKRRWDEMRRRENQQRTYEYWYPQTETLQIAPALSFFGLDSSSANLEIIKKRYRALAKQYHPDAGGDEAKFKELNNANQVLMQHFS